MHKVWKLVGRHEFSAFATGTILLFFSFFYACSGFYAELVNASGIPMNLSYDLSNQTGHASWSYKDVSLKNPNTYLKICNVSSSGYYFIDLQYASESGNLSSSVLDLKPEVYLNASQNCSLVDIDISAFRALYPARPFVVLYYPNGTVAGRYKLNEYFAGSYKVGVDVDSVDKITYLYIFPKDEEGNEINVSYPAIFVSIIRDNKSVAEKLTSPKIATEFNYTFQDEEKVYVNGMLSLKIKTFQPCGVINESGYYIINTSAWNVNSTCLIIENVSNTFINFANHTIDGNYLTNGTKRADVCGVYIRNAENVSIYDARVENFGKGICIEDSKNVKIYGTHTTENLEAIYAKNSTAEIYTISLSSEREEVIANNSLIKLHDVRIPKTTRISLEGVNYAVERVDNPPPDKPGYRNINQFAKITAIANASWVYRITFHYKYPLPNNVTHVVYISKVDGVYINGVWKNLSYHDYEASKKDFVDKNGTLISGYAWIDKNFTSFSIFIPYGINVTVKKPTPVPKPVPKPTPMPSKIAGEKEKVIPPKVNLTLITKNITLQQGETGVIEFEVINEGTIDVSNVAVRAFVRKGWVSQDFIIPNLRPGEKIKGRLYIKVFDDEVPGIYYIPVKALLAATGGVLDTEMLKVKVIPRKRLAKLDILEVLPYLVLPENSKVPVSILVKNTGDYDLHNVRLEIEGAKGCIKKIEGSYDVKKGEKKVLTFYIYTQKAKSKKCTGVYVLKAKEGIVGMYPVIVKIRPQTLMEKIKIFPILYFIWTIITLAIIYRRLRKGE